MAPFLWTQKQDIGPGPLAGHAMAYDSLRDRVVLFGGATATTEGTGESAGDTWLWDGDLWVQVADTGPEGRHGHAMAFDATRGRIVLFGGTTIKGGLLADTWTFDGELWTQVADTGPSARWGSSLTNDSARQAVVLCGGAPSPADVVDTWSWDGGEWTQVADTGPSQRLGHATAELAEDHRILLHGGLGRDGAGLADTWAWNGAAWAALDDVGPPARAFGAMVPLRADALLFGGVASVARAIEPAQRTVHGDTWRWQAGRWVQVQNMGPGGRFAHAMATAAGGRVVLFGGSLFEQVGEEHIGGGFLADTWEHAGAPGVAPASGSIASVVLDRTVLEPGGDGRVGVSVTMAAPANVDRQLSIRLARGAIVGPSAVRAPLTVMVPAGLATTAFEVTRTVPAPPAGIYTVTVTADNGGTGTATFRVD